MIRKLWLGNAKLLLLKGRLLLRRIIRHTRLQSWIQRYHHFVQNMQCISEGQPIQYLPMRLRNRFTLDGRVQLIYHYANNARSAPLVYDTTVIDGNCAKISGGHVGHYGGIDNWLYEALRRFSIAGKRVAIMGSAEQGYGPWYECVCLCYAGRPTTIEYNLIHYVDERIKYVRAPIDIPSCEPFDAAFSISSFEHDGLGRYGDPIDPDGDLKAMQQMKSILKPKSLLFLSVPIGRDKIVFNCHRIYGRARLPLLLDGWDIVDSLGFEESLLDRDTGFGWEPCREVITSTGVSHELLHPEYPEYGPIFVLRNK